MGVLVDAARIVQQEIQRRSDSQRYFNDPVTWAEYMLGARMWSKQKELSSDLTTCHDIAVKAAHATGKSHWVALMIVWWIDTRYPRVNALGQSEVYVASTAPSEKQIGAIVWDYVRKFKNAIHQRYLDGEIDHELPGYITAQNEWKDSDGTMLGMGRKPPDNLADSGFQGVHRRYVLAVGDEATGLKLEMIDALGNITNNPDSRRILIANPTDPSSFLGKIFKEKGMGVWTLHTISALDSPNFKPGKEGLPQELLDNLVDQAYWDRKALEYGEDSPRFKARVLGEFAWDVGDPLITPADLAIAHDTNFVLGGDEEVWLGVDIALKGEDKSSIYVNRGGQVRLSESFDKNSMTELAQWVHETALAEGATEVRYDMLGVGATFEELIWNLSPRPYKLVGMNASASNPPDPRQWFNARAYWWDSFRLACRQGRIDLDPEDERLFDELVSVGYDEAPKGGLLLESKRDMRKRGVKSPDFADAAIYSAVDVDEMLNVPQKKTTAFEEPSDVSGEDFPIFYDFLVHNL